jgi:hypothetical protein
MISKVYFPRLVLPASSVITSLADFLVSAAIMAVLMVWYRYLPSAYILCLPLFIGMAFAIALGAGLWDRSFDGQIPRFPIHRPVYRPVRALHFARWLLLQRGA